MNEMITNLNSRHEAYCAFMKLHHETVWSVCWRFARRKDSRSAELGPDDHVDRRTRAEDMAQEVWIMLWLKFDQLKPETSERQQRKWVERVAERVVIDLYRREKSRPEPLTDYMVENIADADTAPMNEDLEELMACFGPEEQHLMRLYIEGYRGDEIAAMTGLKRDTVYQRIHRAMTKARRVILVILLTVVATSIAVTVVPQWRERVFPRMTKKDKPSEESLKQSPKAAPVGDTLPETAIDTPARRHVVIPLMPIPHFFEESGGLPVVTLSSTHPEALGDSCGCPGKQVRRSWWNIDDSIDDPCEPATRELSEVTITVNENIVVVEGADNEMVSVFDGQGRLVARTQCYGYCMLTVTTDNASSRVSNLAPYWVQVGSRPLQQVFLHFPQLHHY